MGNYSNGGVGFTTNGAKTDEGVNILDQIFADLVALTPSTDDDNLTFLDFMTIGFENQRVNGVITTQSNISGSKKWVKIPSKSHLYHNA